MEKIKKSILFFALLLNLGAAYSTQSVNHKCLQITEHNYIILYVESNDSTLINGFISELMVLTNKVIDARYDYSTHEFTILFTDLLRNDTIYQILLKYFDDFDEVDGKYPIN